MSCSCPKCGNEPWCCRCEEQYYSESEYAEVERERDEARQAAEDLFELQLNTCSACIGHPFAHTCTCRRTLPWRKEAA